MNDDVTWLIKFYETVAAGGQMQRRRTPTSEWQRTDVGPRLGSIDRKQWRIKPKPREWQLFIPDEATDDWVQLYEDSRNLSEPGTVVRVREVIE